MCRWFAYISPTEPCLLEDVLITPDHSISKQVTEHYIPDDEGSDEGDNKINLAFNIDGMGVVWYSKTRSEYISPLDPTNDSYPVAFRSLIHPLADPSFLSICANTSTKTCFGHVRAAVPSDLQPIPTLSLFNCHPFCFGKYSFMHNGGVADFARIRRQLMALMGDEQSYWVKGNTDTEVLAGIFFTYLAEETRQGPRIIHGTVVDLEVLKKTLKRTITDVLAVQKRCVAERPPAPSTLNLAITDGRILITCRFINSTTEAPLSLFYSTTAGSTLNLKYSGTPNPLPPGRTTPRNPPGQNSPDNLPSWVPPNDLPGHIPMSDLPRRLPTKDYGRHVIIASEPTTYNPDEWMPIGKNECVTVGTDGRPIKEPLGVEF